MKESILEKLKSEGKVKSVDYSNKTIEEWMSILIRNSLLFEQHFTKFEELNQDQWYLVLKTIPKFIKKYDEMTKLNKDLTNTNIVVSFFPNTMFWLF